MRLVLRLLNVLAELVKFFITGGLLLSESVVSILVTISAVLGLEVFEAKLSSVEQSLEMKNRQAHDGKRDQE